MQQQKNLKFTSEYTIKKKLLFKITLLHYNQTTNYLIANTHEGNYARKNA